ncbi:unnamed protein product [Pylaiella littoralis]
MSSYDDIPMDFGDDDEANDFLTGQLAALGIDEDLELSGDEEESDDRASAAVRPSAASPEPLFALAAASSLPPVRSATTPSAAAAAAAAEDWGEAPQPVSEVVNNKTPQRTSAERRTEASSPAAVGGKVGEGIEDGELLELLEKPLSASRGRPQKQQQQQQQHGARNSKKNGRRARGGNVTIKECATWMCERLGEPKYYLMCRVVSTIGYKKTRRLLERVQETQQDAGGMPTADGSRKRTAGGVFFTLLKHHMEPAKLKELYADEVRVKKENDRARRAANKRKALAALAGEDVMTPRDPPRKRAQGNGRDRDRVYDRRADGGSATRAGRNMGTWVGPVAAAGGGAADDVVAAKRARASTTLSGDGEGGVAARTLLP